MKKTDYTLDSGIYKVLLVWSKGTGSARIESAVLLFSGEIQRTESMQLYAYINNSK
jgi:hypothetical protein